MVVDGTNKSKHRSPNHPAFSLPVAIERAQSFYDRERLNTVSVDAAIKAMGMSSRGSTGQRALATLLAFGLLEEGGDKSNRRVSLSKSAQTILHRKGDGDATKREAIREAALKPNIHRALYDAYPSSVPSDDELNNFLIERKFNPDSTEHVIAEWRESFSFANLGEHDSVKDEHGDSGSSPPVPDSSRSDGATRPRGQSADRKFEMGVQVQTRTVTVPISGGRMVFIEAPTEFSSADYRMFVAILEAMKDGLINEVPPPQPRQIELADTTE